LASRDEVPSVRRQALATPVLVSNRYTLTRYDTTQDGQAISTYGLACSGNGGDGSYNSLVPGIEQLRIQYGVRGAADMRPSQFLDANAVSALSALTLSAPRAVGSVWWPSRCAWWCVPCRVASCPRGGMPL